MYRNVVVPTEYNSSYTKIFFHGKMIEIMNKHINKTKYLYNFKIKGKYSLPLFCSVVGFEYTSSSNMSL